MRPNFDTPTLRLAYIPKSQGQTEMYLIYGKLQLLSNRALQEAARPYQCRNSYGRATDVRPGPIARCGL
jgi:hypothetical protein